MWSTVFGRDFACSMSSQAPESGPGPSRAHGLASLAIRDAGNGSSSNGSNDTPARPRKRPRRPETWTRNVAKAKRAKGEVYVSPTTGSVVPARQTGPPCNCKSEMLREVLGCRGGSNKRFQCPCMEKKNLQDAYLFGLIKATAVKRRRVRRQSSGRQRKATYTYHVSGKTIFNNSALDNALFC